MDEVIRRTYLDELLSVKDRPDTIKVITGMRRCGKTTLMEQYIRLLKRMSVDDERIVHLDLESRGSARITDHMFLLDEIDKVYTGKRIYVFLDEVQVVDRWEHAVNSLQAEYDADIYIISSNAYLLTDELSTYLSGRYTELHILPLSFSEYLELHPGDREERFYQYVHHGSLPMMHLDMDETLEQDHLIGLFNTILMKDVLENCRGEDIATLTDIIGYLYSNIGDTTSANNIAVSIKKDPEKVRAYLDALQKAFLIYKAERYDIRGKRSLHTLEKYYVSDTGMRNAVLGISSREDVSRQVENIVYLELIRRGYEVAVGKYGDKEVDFTARRDSDIEYIQVTLSMIPENVYDREIAPLNLIRDSYPKTVLSMDRFVIDLPNGLKHVNLLDWLLNGS